VGRKRRRLVVWWEGFEGGGHRIRRDRQRSASQRGGVRQSSERRI